MAKYSEWCPALGHRALTELATIRVLWRCVDCWLEEVEENGQRYVRFSPERARRNIGYGPRARLCPHVRRIVPVENSA